MKKFQLIGASALTLLSAVALAPALAAAAAARLAPRRAERRPTERRALRGPEPHHL